MATTIAKGVDNSAGEYALGYSHAEHDRLIRQATLFASFTERLFRDAGIGSGQRVLDLGSGVGDVSLLLARMVGPSGGVVGIERDAESITRAAARVRAAGFHNVNFREGDIAKIAIREDCDAVVGRLILEFLPDAGAIVASLAGLIRPGGLLAIQDAYWGSLLQLTAGLPLFSKCASLVFTSVSSSPAHTWTWNASSTGVFEKLAFQLRACGSMFRSEILPFSVNGLPISCAACSHKCKGMVLPVTMWESSKC